MVLAAAGVFPRLSSTQKLRMGYQTIDGRAELDGACYLEQSPAATHQILHGGDEATISCLHVRNIRWSLDVHAADSCLQTNQALAILLIVFSDQA
jgi:hypothetical protein